MQKMDKVEMVFHTLTYGTVALAAVFLGYTMVSLADISLRILGI